MSSRYELFINLLEITGEYFLHAAHETVQYLCQQMDTHSSEDYDINKDCLTRELWDIAKRLESAEKIAGTAAEFHNLAVEYARMDWESVSCMIIEKAMKLPHCEQDIDLMADYLKYCIAPGKMEKGLKIYNKLLEIDISRWNWRAFSFTIDFMLASCDQNGFQKKDILALADKFIRRISGSEEPYISKAAVYAAYNDRESEQRILLEALQQTGFRHTKIHLRLADLYFAQGDYETALLHATSAYNNASAPQPMISSSYVYSLAGLCRISIFFNAAPDEQQAMLEETYKQIRKELDCASKVDRTPAYQEFKRQWGFFQTRFPLQGSYEFG
ncbi:MAG: hypothetical protein IJ418_16000 [Clostridia bacterium]|nr:hypothetical protein [Clostridia bacterium]